MGRKYRTSGGAGEPGNEDNKLDRKIRILAVWYVLLAGLEDVETPRRGFCFVAAINSFEFGQVQHSVWRRNRCAFQLFPTMGPAEFLWFEVTTEHRGSENSRLHH